MNNVVKGYLAGMPQDFIIWLESLRNKNPLRGSDSCRNSNSVFVEIGKNIIVDTLLDERQNALNPRKPSAQDVDGSDLMMKPIIE